MKLIESQFTSAEFSRNLWTVTPEPGTAFETVLKPEYWAHVAKKLRRGDRIEVLSEDNSYFAELIVLSAAPLWAKVAVLRNVELATAPKAEASQDDFEIKHRGKMKWSVLRKSDKAILKEGLDTREQAEAWLNTPVAA